MRQVAFAVALLATAACAPRSARDGLHMADGFSHRTIARIESGLALAEDLETVGVADSKTMNRASRVRVRNVGCRSVEGSAVTCSYEASRCLYDELDPDGDGWCRRARSFVRVSGYANPLTSVNGWTVDGPPR